MVHEGLPVASGHAAGLASRAGAILRSVAPSLSSARSRSYWACMPIQNAGEVRKYLASRNAVSAVTAYAIKSRT
jgi:hypothetical protein